MYAIAIFNRVIKLLPNIEYLNIEYTVKYALLTSTINTNLQIVSVKYVSIEPQLCVENVGEHLYSIIILFVVKNRIVFPS